MSSSNEHTVQNYDDSDAKENSHGTKCDFEEAISATGFGWHNYGVIVLGCIANIVVMFETTSFSFVVPVLQCDLELPINKMGLLNSIMFLGMICGSVVWGIISDIFGRRKLLTIGILVLGLVNLALALSNTFELLMAFKFLSGFVVCGPITIIIAYVTEMHGVRYRVKVIVLVSIFYSMGNLIVSLMGLIFLTRSMKMHFLGMTFLSWHLLFLTLALIDVVVGILASFMPESPKFYMSHGRHDEALQVLRIIYRRNTGKHPDTYPIKSLADENESQHEMKTISKGVEELNFGKTDDLSGKIKKAFIQIAPMFKPPHVTKCFLACGTELFLLMGLNSLRLWMPQVFSLMADDGTGTEFDFCDKLQSDSGTLEENRCLTSSVQPASVFYNSMIVQSVGVVGATLICIFINVIHNKFMLVGTTVVAGLASVAVYFSINPLMVVSLFSIAVGLSFAAQACFSSILPNIVPTAFRSTVISISLTCGRAGSMIGTYFFPRFMELNCWVAFVANGIVLFTCAIFSIFLPRSTKKTLL